MPYGNPVGPGGSLAWVLFYSAIPMLVHHFYQQDKLRDQQEVFSQMDAEFGLPENETFDFIIVGAGTAGCIVARRLSEKYSVLLLEAGGEPPPGSAITVVVGYTKQINDIHWVMRSVRKPNVAIGIGGEGLMTSGKMLGGSGSHNDVQYERGSPYDFDNWANFTGDPSWRYENVLKYFLMNENYQGQFTMSNGQHSTEGMVSVEASPLPFNSKLWFEAGIELGYGVNLDANGPQRIGFCPAEYNRKKGQRASAYTEYVKPIIGSKNLTIRKYSYATEIIIKNCKATGIYYEQHGIKRVAFASKEVILSAGAYNTPVLLMRSGIGPRDQIEAIGKTPVLEVPAVGKNYQSHVVLDLGITVEDKSVFRMSPNTVTFDDLAEFKRTGGGFLAARSSNQEAFVASTRAATVDGVPDWPDLQLYFYMGYVNKTDILNCTVSLSRPKSAGRVFLNTSATTLEGKLAPVLDHNLFSDESDFDVMLQGIEICQKIVNTTAFQKVGAKFLEGPIPECADHVDNHRAYWICFMRHRAFWNVHASCTARMGPACDDTSVVDSKMRVKGIEGLRIVDASVFPFVTNSNINAAVMLVGEKGAKEILNAWA